ncbi:MAG: hypothetical protein WDM89_07825 [Rhizomicrobium sp.]
MSEEETEDHRGAMREHKAELEKARIAAQDRRSDAARQTQNDLEKARIVAQDRRSDATLESKTGIALSLPLLLSVGRVLQRNKSSIWRRNCLPG